MNYLVQGCSLARNLESNLAKLGNNNQARIVAQQCDEIIEVFTMAKHHLITALHTHHHHHHHHHDPEVEEEDQEVGGKKDVAHAVHSKRIPKRSSRKDEKEGKRERVRIAAPQIGSVEVPPDDGFSWRKYGQKEILGAKNPRSYYRCTHQKLYNCPAKKQVQRVDDDPFTFEILYRGEHICHKSSTAPSVPPTPSPAVQNIMMPLKSIATVNFQLNHWLPVDFPRTSAEAGNTVSLEPNNVNEQQPLPLRFRLSSTPGSYEAPSTSTVGSHHHGIDVADFLNQMAGEDFTTDVIFNSEGCSTHNDMEVKYPPATSDDKLEAT